MKISINWLLLHLDNVDKLVLNPEKYLLPLGFEVEEIEYINKLELCTINNIKKVTDHLNLCTIITVNKAQYDVICGAPNVYIGMKTIWAKPGTHIKDMVLGIKKIQGYNSPGMLCSIEELNTINNINLNVLHHKNISNNGIVDLNNTELNIYEDMVIHTSIATNRWDLNNIRGIAINLEYLGVGKLRPMILQNKPHDICELDIDIVNNTNVHCSFQRVKNITIDPIIFSLLNNINKKSNNILQCLNDFILLDIGHPIHIYDASKLNGITLNYAPKNGTFKCLNDKIINTNGEEIIIYDKSDNPLCIGGMMGIEGFSHDTMDIIIEAIWFKPNNISSVISTSSKLFNFGVPRYLCTLEYINNFINGIKSNIIYLNNNNLDITYDINKIFLSHNRFELITGLSLSLDTISHILSQYGFTSIVTRKEKYLDTADEFGLLVSAPEHRTDIRYPEDIIFQMINHLNINTLDISNIKLNNQVSYKSEKIIDNNHIYLKNILCMEGLVECINLPFTSEQTSIQIINSINPTKSYIRENCLHSLLENTIELHKMNIWPIKLFEIYNNKLNILLYGKSYKTWNYKEDMDIFYMKKLLNKISHIIDIQEIKYDQVGDDLFFKKIILSNGYCGIIKYLPEYDISGSIFCEIDIKYKDNINYNNIIPILSHNINNYFDITIETEYLFDYILNLCKITADDYKLKDYYVLDNIKKYTLTIFNESTYNNIMNILTSNNINIK